MANPVTHFEIQGSDGAKSQEFYRSLFGWEIDANNPMAYGMVSKGADNGIGGGVTAAMNKPMVTFYVEVEDLAATLAKAEAQGGTKLMDPMDVPGGPTIAMFADPDGNAIGIMKGM